MPHCRTPRAGAALALFASLGLAGANAGAAVTVHGTVTAQDSGLPLAGVSVSVGSRCGGDGCFTFRHATTGDDGTYEATDNGPGGIFVQASYPLTGPNFVIGLAQTSATDGESLAVDLALAPGATIAGTVRRQSDGAAVANQTLDLDGTPTGTGPYPYHVATTASDANGHYRFPQLAAGSYTVHVRSDDGTDDGIGSTPYQDQFSNTIALAAAEQISGIDFSLLVGATISGTLTDRYSGLPIANLPRLEFDLYDPAAAPGTPRAFERRASTDALGRYVLDGLPNGSFALSAGSLYYGYAVSYFGCTPDPCAAPSQATTLQLTNGAQLTADFSLFPGAVIKGTVTRRSDGAPIANALVESYSQPTFFRDGKYTFAHAYTDAAGHYTLSGNMPYIYVAVSATTAGGVAYLDQVWNDHNCAFGDCTNIGAQFLPPAYAVTSNIDFALDPAAAITGQVRAAGVGVAATVYLYQPNVYRSLAAIYDSAPDGTFATSGLQPGTYYAAAVPLGANTFLCAFYGGVVCGCDIVYCILPPSPPADAQPIVVGTQNVDGIVITLPSDALFTSGFE